MCHMSSKRDDGAATTGDNGLAEAIGAALAKHLAPVLSKFAPPDREAIDEARKRVIDEIRGVGRPMPEQMTVERCVSDDTGASFDLWIEGGIVKELRNYTPAPGYDKSVDEGGRVPRGMAIDPEDKWGYARWLSDEWRSDLARYVGRKPFDHMIRAARERATATTPAT